LIRLFCNLDGLSRDRVSLFFKSVSWSLLGDNVFIIYSRFNHNYENFTIGVISGRIGSDIRSSSVGSFLVLDHIRSGIRSFSVWSFRVSGRIRSGQVGYQVISGFESYQVGLGRVSDYLVFGHFGFRVVSGPVGSDIGSFSVRL
jgi:hypothetical protein